jgi:TPR repeat protein
MKSRARIEGVDGAESWFRHAANGGNSEAMYNLGLLRDEQGVVDGLDGALHWFGRACDLGFRAACERLNR